MTDSKKVFLTDGKIPPEEISKTVIKGKIPPEEIVSEPPEPTPEPEKKTK